MKIWELSEARDRIREILLVSSQESQIGCIREQLVAAIVAVKIFHELGALRPQTAINVSTTEVI